MEAPRSQYKGKKLPLARSTVKQPLILLPELQEELTCSNAEHPYSSWSPISKAYALDCEAMEKLGSLRLPPVEPLIAGHLHPRSSTSSLHSPSLHLKSERVQSALSEWAYWAAAIPTRAVCPLSPDSQLGRAVPGLHADAGSCDMGRNFHYSGSVGALNAVWFRRRGKC